MEIPNVAGAMVAGSRRNEDIALDLLKFVAAHTDVGKGPGVGFQTAGGKGSQEAADKILELYGKCLNAVGGKK
jgi:hypothetical protein